jgi:hypothetical protein
MDIIKNIWEYIRYYDVLPSHDSVLAGYGQTVKSLFPEFTVWNYFTGDRADTLFHDDGIDYPHIPLDNVLTCPFNGVVPNNPPDGMAANYIMSYPQSSYSGLLYVGFDGYNLVEWSFSYVAFKDDEYVVKIDCYVNPQGKTDCGIYDFMQYDSILFIPCVVSRWQNNNPYLFDMEIYPFGDIDGSGYLNILDITHLINYIYFDGLAPKYDVLMGDTNCDGYINLLDVAHLISTLYHGGPLPCWQL